MASRMVSKLIGNFQTAEYASSPSAILRSLRNCKRAFATSAARASAPDDSVVEVRRAESASKDASRPSRSGSFSDFYNPLRADTSLGRMLDAVDRIFDVPFGSSFSTTFPTRFRTPWDVLEDNKCFKLRMDMPGLSKEELKISVEDGDLVIKGEHSAEEKEEDWSSRSYAGYNTRISLPDNVQLDQIKAELKDGVLRVTAPKTEVKKNVIDVKVN